MHPDNEKAGRTAYGGRRNALRLALNYWLVAVAMFSALPVYSQDASPPLRSKKAPPQAVDRSDVEEESSPAKKDATFGVDVNQVVLNTTVLDRNGKFVEGLHKEDFTVYENRVQQTINTFSREDLPVTLGLVIDTSGSMRTKIDPVSKASLLLIQSSNPEDEVFIIGFNTEATLVEDFTNDIRDLRDSLDNLIVGGGTALYDAIYLAVKKAQEGHKQKKAIVVITDGEDRDSHYKLEEVLEKIREANVQVYTIGFLDPEEQRGLFEGLFKKSRQKRAHEVLEKVAEETGGKSVFPKEITEIDQIVKTIAQELRNQYSIGYISNNQAKDGSWRAVRVALNRSDANKYKVRARSGYYAPKK